MADIEKTLRSLEPGERLELVVEGRRVAGELVVVEDRDLVLEVAGRERRYELAKISSASIDVATGTDD